MAHRDPLVGQGGHPDSHWGDGQMEPAAGPLLRPGDKIGGQPALFRGLLDDAGVEGAVELIAALVKARSALEVQE